MFINDYEPMSTKNKTTITINRTKMTYLLFINNWSRRSRTWRGYDFKSVMKFSKR